MTLSRPRFWMPLTLACCGCASAPVSYYTLLPPAASSSTEPPNACCVVEVRNVRIPPQVDRPELVVRRSDEEVALLSNDLWIAPLRDEVRSALLHDIRTALPRGEAGEGAGIRKFVLFVDVSRFESEPDKYALIEAGWRLEPVEDLKRTAPVCRTIAQVDIGGGVAGVVQGYQRAMSRIASSVATGMLAAQDGSEVKCPMQAS